MAQVSDHNAGHWGTCDVEQRIEEGLTRLGRTAAGIRRLAGDASVRRFYRMETGPGGATEILMDTGGPFTESDDPFCLTARFLRENRLPVPAIRGVDGESGLVLLEDLGDTMLEGRGPEESLYGAAVDLVADLQDLDTGCLPSWLPARQLFFDRKKLLWELQFFHHHFFGGLLGLKLPTDEEAALQAFYRSLSGGVADLRPRVFCHRDYHSRNLMVTGCRLVMVDFQDARLGPETYDLVSLLRDCYVDVGRDLEERLIHRYLQRRSVPGGREAFRSGFELTALQRGIKAAGTFAYQAVERGNRRYLAAMPLTIRHIDRAFRAIPEFDQAGRAILSRLQSL